MFTYKVDDEVELRLLNTCHAPTLFALVDANRSYLREWLPWLDSNREEQDSVRFIAWSRHQFAENKDIVAGIWYRGTLVGLVGLHGMTAASHSASIGYWLARDFEGRGIVTRATRAVLDYAFQELQLNRVEIRCAPGNVKSHGVPLRLGFTREGTLRRAERLYDRYEDSIVFATLRTEWPARASGT